MPARGLSLSAQAARLCLDEAVTTNEDSPRRAVTLTRTERGRYVVRNSRGQELEFGHGDDLFTPVELLLAAVGGCSAIDVDFVASRRAEPESFSVEIAGDKIKDERGGSRMQDIVLDFSVRFPAGEAGEAAASTLERTVQQSRDRLCTVSRTVQLETSVEYRIDGRPV